MNKKRKIACLTVLAAMICIPALALAQTDSEQSQKASDPNSSAASTDFLNDLFKDRQDIPRPQLLKHFVSAIAIVIILGVIAYVLSKKVVPKLSISSGRAVNVIETVNLGSKRSLHVLKIGTDRKILIGSTNENINYLAEITLALEDSKEESIEEK